MENKTILGAVLLALSLMAGVAQAADLTVGEIQRLKNEASQLKQQDSVNELRKKLEADATPKVEEKVALAPPPMPPVLNGAMGAEMAAPVPEFCSGYTALLIRGTGEKRTALISGVGGTESFVKVGDELADGCKVVRIDEQSLKVRTPAKGKGKKSKGKLKTIVLGAEPTNSRDNDDFSRALPPVPPIPGMQLNGPTMGGVPMAMPSQAPGAINSPNPYAGY